MIQNWRDQKVPWFLFEHTERNEVKSIQLYNEKTLPDDEDVRMSVQFNNFNLNIIYKKKCIGNKMFKR